MPPNNSFSLRQIAIPAFGPSVLFGTAEGAIFPILALSATQLGASAAAAGLIVALINIGSLLSNLPAALITTRFGERRAMVGAAGISLIGVLLCLTAHNIWALGFGVFLVGAAAAVFQLARQSFLIEAVPVHMRARAMSTLGGTMRIGLFFGPFLGAACIHFFGLAGAYWAAFIALLGTGALAMAVPDLQVRAKEETPPPPVRLKTLVHTHQHAFMTLGIATALVSAIRACRQIVIPLWAEHIGLDATDTALIYGIMGAVDMLLFYPAGKVMDRRGRVWVAVPCMLIMGLSFLAMPLTTGFASLLTISMVMGFGNGIGSGIIMTIGADASPRHGRTAFLGLWRQITDTGGGGGPLILSGLTGMVSLSLGIGTIGSLGLIAAWMFWRWLPRSIAKAPPTP